ncbi:MAG: hypothetical protein ACJ760_05290 [Thermoleophilaceae bacterium]
MRRLPAAAPKRGLRTVAAHDNVVSLADRVLGECPGCGGPVLFAENFIRTGHLFVHIACALRAEGRGTPGGGDFPRPVPPPARGA